MACIGARARLALKAVARVQYGYLYMRALYMYAAATGDRGVVCMRVRGTAARVAYYVDPRSREARAAAGTQATETFSRR